MVCTTHGSITFDARSSAIVRDFWASKTLVSHKDFKSRAMLGAILPLHDVRYHATACCLWGITTVAELFFDGRASRPRAPRENGGARRDRTDDLLLAKQALSQLSYGPGERTNHVQQRRLVGLGRFELPTSRLSSARSNQLSYKPGPGASYQQSVIS